MLRSLVLELLVHLIFLGLGLFIIGGSTYGFSSPAATAAQFTPDQNPPHEKSTTTRPTDFVNGVSPIFIRAFLVGGFAMGLGFCMRSIAAMIAACCIYVASRRYPGEPWKWLPAWRAGLLDVPVAQFIFGAGFGLGALGLGLLMLFGSIGINIVEPGKASFALSACYFLIACLMFLASWVALRGSISEAVWGRRLTCRLIELPTRPGGSLSIDITFDPRFTPPNGIRVCLRDRLRGLKEVETIVEQSPGHIVVRCTATDGTFINMPRIERCAWQLWLSSRRFSIHYLVPVFIVPPAKSLNGDV